MNLLLIDADSFLYNACVCKKEQDPENEGYIRDLEIAQHKFDELVQGTIMLNDKYELQIDKYKVFIQGKNNFRKFVNPSYKEGREFKRKPPLLNEIFVYAIEKYNAYVVDGCETDDAIASVWNNYRLNNYVVIAANDKDYKQLPCVLFDTYYARQEMYSFGLLDAQKFFWTQMLMGDGVDSVKGVRGVGEKGAEKLLRGIDTRLGMLKVCIKEYKRVYGRKWREVFKTTFLMLKLRTDVIVDFEWD